MFHAAATDSRVDLTKEIYSINKLSIVEKKTAILPFKPMKFMVFLSGRDLCDGPTLVQKSPTECLCPRD
jgi:hypothetical protein